MPRLPTIRVIGSQAISMRSACLAWVASFSVAVIVRSPRLLVAGAELGALGAPGRLLVGRALGEAAQRADDGAVHTAGGAGHAGTGRLVHERHELVGKARHRAGDA